MILTHIKTKLNLKKNNVKTLRKFYINNYINWNQYNLLYDFNLIENDKKLMKCIIKKQKNIQFKLNKS